MSKMLYIGYCSTESTSKLRSDCLRLLIKVDEFKIIDLDIPIQETNRIFRSLGWRYKKGPLISRINQFISTEIGESYQYDLVWIDKGVFIHPSLIRRIRECSKLLIHYTPDAAFVSNQSKLFFRSLKYYDYCVTTKSFEVSIYKNKGAKNVLLCTQGYQPLLHKPYNPFAEKKGIIFIGNYEKNRAQIISELLKNGFDVQLAGPRWQKFAEKRKNISNFRYFGNSLFGEDYARALSAALFGIGFLSKIIPELHTTRSIEIPACGTALITEETSEISEIYDQNEVIIFKDTNDLIKKLRFFLHNIDLLKKVTDAGHNKIVHGGFDYNSIIKNILVESHCTLLFNKFNSSE